MIDLPEYIEQIIFNALKRYPLDRTLLKAVIRTESGNNPWAVRAEVAKHTDKDGIVIYRSLWRYYYYPNIKAENVGSSVATEWIMQATSWGLFQIMGSVARELNFTGWMTELLLPETNVDYGCRIIKSKIEKYGDDPATIYAAYNAGSIKKTRAGSFINQVNVDRFMLHYRELSRSIADK